MEKKVILIPDIHGRTFWKDALDYINSETPVVFLGDYTDPYLRENISNEEALENFKEILEATKNRKNITLLLGNHDIAYMFPDDTRIRNRTDFDNFPMIWSLFQANSQRFRLATEFEGYIISHAGIRKEWLDYAGINIKDIINIPAPRLMERVVDHLEILSHYRDEDWGGDFGSIVWADIQEFRKETMAGDQIVGHTQTTKPIRIGNVVDLDCKRCFFIDGEGDIRELETEEVVL